ncbi:uncharacterized protein LOC135692423 isoform X2 [Rhopilema esculentum]
MTIAGCLFDGDCPGAEKCCFDGCRTTCAKANIVEVMKNQSRSCPEIEKANGDCKYVDDSAALRECQTGDDCSSSENCCYDGCRKICTSIKEPEKLVVKDGVCPPVDDSECASLLLEEVDILGGRILEQIEGCSMDRDCNDTKKCCYSGCQRKCIEPFVVEKVDQIKYKGEMEENHKSKDIESQEAKIVGKELSTGSKMKANRLLEKERTFVMIKPDAVKRGLISDILKRFERKGYKMVAIKLAKPSRLLLLEHYIHLKVKSMLEDILEYVGSGPVVVMIWQGTGVVDGAKAILGANDPLTAKPGTVRGDFTLQIGKDIVYSSESEEKASREIGLWFGKDELVDW